MMEKIIPPELQIMKLNEYLIRHAHRLPSPVITVGGQAVMYWYAYYLYAYQHKPIVENITSVDVDYVTQKETVKAIASIFNVEPNIQEHFTPPSIAILDLIDKNTGKVKKDSEGLFLDPRSNTANLIDIIDRPTGFGPGDFSGKTLALNTEQFYVETDTEELSSEKVLILSPIACIRSRLANATAPMGKDKQTEAERIKALAVPVFNYLLEKFRENDFKESRIYLDYFCEIIWKNQYRRYQVTYGLPLYSILEGLYQQLRDYPEGYIYPEAFLKQELPRKIAFYKKRYERISELVNTD